MGVIQSKINLTDRVSQYNASVDAISCLTEEDHFHGNTEYLKEIRKILPLPIIRKDFIIDDYQVYEAKVIGVTETPHIEFLKKCNVDALLIGRAFMESESPLEVAKEWKAVYNRI